MKEKNKGLIYIFISIFVIITGFSWSPGIGRMFCQGDFGEFCGFPFLFISILIFIFTLARGISKFFNPPPSLARKIHPIIFVVFIIIVAAILFKFLLR